MKTIVFAGKEYSVPSWAKFITQDSSGVVTIHQTQPKSVYDDSSGISYWRSHNQTEDLDFPSCYLMEIK